MSQTTRDWPVDTRVEEIAKMLWHRFAPAHHVEWEHEKNKGEYEEAAEAAIKIACKPVEIERVPFVIEDRS